LLHSHLFLHDQLTFADISGTDIGGREFSPLSDWIKFPPTIDPRQPAKSLQPGKMSLFYALVEGFIRVGLGVQ
jgi:hypothetical protein